MLQFRHLLFFVIINLCFVNAKAQLFYNNGADVAVTPGGILYIDGATENAAGLFKNGGQTWIVGYFRNGSLANGGDTTGIYNVYGDWENNNVFTADRSNVNLTGNTQLITGSQETTFHDLTLLTQGAVKRQTLDAYVNHVLNLNDCELATVDNKMTVTNYNYNAVLRHNGFVSSISVGRLIRYTNTNHVYLFPTGWNDNGDIWYRPVEITPSVADQQSYAVRMAYANPTDEGYDVDIHATDVSKVNTKYFHLIKQFASTSPSNLSIYYDQQRDGTWESIGRWQGTPEWEDLTDTHLTPGFPLSHRTKSSWIDNGFEPHAFINTKDSDVIPFNFPNVFDPNGNDPNNSTFHIINQLDLVTLTDLKIFDRWGEMVFDSQRDGTMCNLYGGTTYCWDGKYRGKLQPMGNYVYMASVKIKKTNEIRPVTGNLSLLW